MLPAQAVRFLLHSPHQPADAALRDLLHVQDTLTASPLAAAPQLDPVPGESRDWVLCLCVTQKGMWF